jgi:hypothetical protein
MLRRAQPLPRHGDGGRHLTSHRSVKWDLTSSDRLGGSHLGKALRQCYSATAKSRQQTRGGEACSSSKRLQRARWKTSPILLQCSRLSRDWDLSLAVSSSIEPIKTILLKFPFRLLCFHLSRGWGSSFSVCLEVKHHGYNPQLTRSPVNRLSAGLQQVEFDVGLLLRI